MYSNRLTLSVVGSNLLTVSNPIGDGYLLSVDHSGRVTTIDPSSLVISSFKDAGDPTKQLFLDISSFPSAQQSTLLFNSDASLSPQSGGTGTVTVPNANDIMIGDGNGNYIPKAMGQDATIDSDGNITVNSVFGGISLSAVATTGLYSDLAGTPSPNFSQHVWVDAVNGSDGSGQLRDPNSPYATIATARNVAAAATGNWIIHIRPGTYSDTGIIPLGSNYNIATYWEPGAVWSPTGSGHLFDISAVSESTKTWWVLGHGTFLAASAVTGKVINSNYNVTSVKNFIFEADAVYGTAWSGSTGFWNFNGATGLSGTPQPSVIKVNFFAGDATGNHYLRVGGYGTICFNCRTCTGIDLEDGLFIINAEKCGSISLDKNGFSANGVLHVKSMYCAAGGGPVFSMRNGSMIIDSPLISQVDGNAPAIDLATSSDTTGCSVTIRNAIIKANASSTYAAIRMTAASSNHKVRLVNCELLVHASASNSFSTNAAQTIDGIGSLYTNKALDGSITVQGATVVTNASFFTTQ